jgi:2-hydroxy-6-oxonona-2,4-dienedioate hydrolase
MTDSADFPARVTDLAQARAIEARAERYETECGAGRMVWRAWGAGAPAVLVHGGSGNWSHWVRNIGPLVAAGHRVVVPDLPGCGESDRPPEGEDGDVLPQWIEKGVATLIPEGAFDLVGFSFGAMVSGFFAAAYPSRVKRLVLVGAPGLSAARTTKLPLKEWLRLPDGPEREAAFRANLRMLMVARDESVDELSLTLYAEALRQDRLTKRRLAATDILLKTMPDIRCPVWSMWGAEDALYRGRFDVAEHGMRQARDLRSYDLLAHAGHWAQYEAADEFDALLASALS